MFMFNGFEYNDCGVCVNPETPYSFGKWNECHFSIMLSETPDGWVYGYHWGTASEGGGCSINTKETYPSQPKAIVACADRIRRFFSGDRKAAKAIAELDKIISEESVKRPKLKQYTIFDYL